MESPIKLKRLSIKLNRVPFVGVTPEQVQEQILDQRVRRCSVRLQRCSEATILAHTALNVDGQKMKRFCIRLPRLHLTARSEISQSPTISVVSSCILSDPEIRDFDTEDA